MRGFAWRAAGLGLWLCACATGAGDVDFEEGDAGGSTGSGGEGGAAGQSCTTDAYCQDLSGDCQRGRCVDGRCVAEPANESLSCEDDDPCTTMGRCVAGTCQGSGTIDCSALDDACGVGVCDSARGCVREPANEGMSCDDGLFCTDNDVCDAAGECAGPDPHDCGLPTNACAESTCDETLGACAETPVTACVSGDGCCPSGCSLPEDDDCSCGTNHALNATPSSSGGGQATCCAVSEMNNGVTEPVCAFHWIDNDASPGGAFIEYQWATPVTIGSTYIATQHATSSVCGSSGRNVNSGSVQYWNGASWVTAATFSGQLDDVAVDLPAPITTTRLRIYDMTTSPGNGNSIIYEWFVYPSAGCTP